MGQSIRARAAMRERHQAERAERERLEAEAAQAAAEFHRDYLDRHRTAAALSVSVHKLKRMMHAGLGPQPLKMGETQQSRTFWEASEIARYLENPAAYEAEKRMPSPD